MKKRHKNNKKNSHSMNQTEEKKVQQEELNEQATEETVAGESLTDKEATEETEKKELTPEEQMQQQLIACEEKIAAQQDQILRQAAEFDNYRKRTLKEKAELIKNGGEKTLTAILPVLDDFERALKNMEASEETKAMKEGVELIFNKFQKILGQEGLQKIETEGQAFDVDFHEAIALIPAPSEDLKGKILDCVQTGYMLNDKVIRHAKVAVAQ